MEVRRARRGSGSCVLFWSRDGVSDLVGKGAGCRAGEFIKSVGALVGCSFMEKAGRGITGSETLQGLSGLKVVHG